MVGFGPEEQLCTVEDRVDSTGAARRVATTGLMVQTAQKTALEVASFFLSAHTGFSAEEGAAALVVDNMFMAGFAGHVALRAVFPSIGRRRPLVVDNGDM